jgi:hypothetical protein
MSQSSPGDLKRSSDEPPMGEPSSKRILETTLESIPNDLADATHARLDEEVRNRVQVLHEEPEVPNAIILLDCIISCSDGLLDQKYTNGVEMQRLYKNHPELQDKLKEAWSTNKSFKEIRNLGTCITLLSHLAVVVQLTAISYISFSNSSLARTLYFNELSRLSYSQQIGRRRGARYVAGF